MRAVVQRVSSASVVVGGEVVGQVGPGLLAYVGAERGDTEVDVAYIVRKIAGLRVFVDDEGKMSRAAAEVGGAVLLISQFTLFGDVRRGRRPSFDRAAEPSPARRHYDAVLSGLREAGLEVAAGRFQASMQVHSVGEGPVTILIDSRKLF